MPRSQPAATTATPTQTVRLDRVHRQQSMAMNRDTVTARLSVPQILTRRPQCNAPTVPDWSDHIDGEWFVSAASSAAMDRVYREQGIGNDHCRCRLQQSRRSDPQPRLTRRNDIGAAVIACDKYESMYYAAGSRHRR